LERIVTTVDAVFAAQQLTDYAESRKQVALADVLVLTKSDLASFSAKRQVDDALQRLNPVANVHVATHGAVDAAALFPPSLFTPTGSHEIPAREPFYAEDVTASKHLDRILAVTLVANAALTWSAFERWLRDIRLTYAEQILRLKGLVDVVGSAGPVVVQGVHHVLHTPVELGSWPHDEQGTRLLFIVQDLLPDVLRTRWHDFLLAERVCV
jgi:G3E family GTPase